ncbi:hypothetical protein [Ruegeria arenilitoris]|uniref:hypothetical protein n=1 Tax=Ruegeria arenilitoris TaxID=1173585 RepID=UPI003F5CEC5D
MTTATQSMLVNLQVRAQQAISQTTRYNNALKQTEVGLRSVQREQARTRAGIGRVGNAVQQASYQFTDFVVQVQSGQSAVRALGQQGSQLLAIFGPAGAMAGLALAIGTAFVGPMLAARDAASKVNDELQDMRDAADRIRFGVETQTELNAMRALLDAQVRYAQIREQWQKTDSLATRQRLAEEANGLKAVIAANQDLLDQYAAARRELEELRKEAEATVTVMENLVGFRVKDIFEGANELADGFFNRIWLGYQEMLGMAARVKQEQLEAFGGEGDPFYSTQRTFRPSNFGSGGGGGGGGRGGAGSTIDTITEDIKRMLPQVQKAIDAYSQWDAILGKDMVDSFQSLAQEGISGLIDMIGQADASFSDFAKNFLREASKMILQMIIMTALKRAFGGGGGGFADGAAIDAGQVVPFANGGVVNSPTLFPMARGRTGLMGEAGPEAIMPLQRNSSGQLGVSGPSIRINNYSGQEVQVTRSDDEVIEIAVGRARQAAAQDFAESMQSGHGVYAKSMEQSYSGRRKAF